MREGMFLGYKVNADGLKVCPDKVEAVLSLPSPKCLKDVQKLNGKLASLNRFLSKSSEKSLPFFKTLKKCIKKSDFLWIVEVETAFKQMNKLIAKLPMLTAPKEKEELVIYLAAAKEAINAVLMTKRDGKQMPIYSLAVHYKMLSNPKVTGRLLKWRFELEEHDIHYRPRTSVKGQILADFIVERSKDDSPDTPIKDKEELSDPWILFTNGSSYVDGSEAGPTITNPKGIEFTYALRFRFDATNNEAEYEPLIAEQIGVQNLQANIDSRLMANQVNGTYVAKDPGMIKYLEKEKLIDEKELLAVVVEEGRTWMTPIYEYPTEEILPEEKRKARAIHRKEGRYAVTNKVLYKRSFLGPWLRCVRPLHANYVLREIHVQHARRPKIYGGESSKIRILLANYARRGQQINKGVQKLSGSSPCAKEPTAKLDPNRIPAAILKIGDRHSWSFPGRSR
nr:hypothetical protein [Tanacetum cinerariifolium]